MRGQPKADADPIVTHPEGTLQEVRADLQNRFIDVGAEL
jgi:hypothetical protein